MATDWNVLWSSGLGALAGSTLTLLATYCSHRWQLSSQENKDQKMLLGVLQAIHDEIETLWDNYMEGVGRHTEVLPDNQPLDTYWPITQEYFTVYNTNAFFIGRIGNHDLRKLIVSTYSKARGLIDTYRLNNDLVQKHQHANWLSQETQNQVHKTYAAGQLAALTAYSKSVKNSHAEVKKQVYELLRALRKEGVFNKPQID